MKRVVQLASISCLLFGSGLAFAQKLEPAHSEITFTIRQFGVPVEGRFTKFGGQFAFDPKKPSTSKVALAIDTGSARFGAPETDDEVGKAAWFNVPKFPQATLESTAIKAMGSGKYDVIGRLSIKGASRDVQIPVVLTQNGSATFATGAFTVKRLDFKIGDGEWSDTSIVANEVQVKFKLALSGISAL